MIEIESWEVETNPLDCYNRLSTRSAQNARSAYNAPSPRGTCMAGPARLGKRMLHAMHAQTRAPLGVRTVHATCMPEHACALVPTSGCVCTRASTHVSMCNPGRMLPRAHTALGARVPGCASLGGCTYLDVHCHGHVGTCAPGQMSSSGRHALPVRTLHQ